ncbi:MAG: hypothetical protein HGA49_06325 [Eubacteriaceae bacterium]|nr:hypothetical protein [Eubacteriaceae bacterium]
MKNSFQAIIKWASIGNLAHLGIAVTSTYIAKDNMLLMVLVTLLTLGIWFFTGFFMGKSTIKFKEADYLLLGVVSILPIVSFTVAGQVLEGISSTLSTLQNYNLLYFIGAPVLFWNNPFYPIMDLFRDSNIYIQININIIIVFFVVFAGGYFGRSVKIHQLKKSRKISKAQ